MSGNGKEKKMKQIVLVAETGSDINPVLAAEYNIKIVPMHVSFDHETMEDGAFPVEKIVDYYEETGKLPKTSGSTPGDFETAFDRIHAEYPDAQLLYLAYSAVTTCSMQSAVLAAEERDYVTILDTKFRRAVQCGDCRGGAFAAAPRLDDGRSSPRGGGFDCKGEDVLHAGESGISACRRSCQQCGISGGKAFKSASCD